MGGEDRRRLLNKNSARVGEPPREIRAGHLGLAVAFQKLSLIGTDFVKELFKDQPF